MYIDMKLLRDFTVFRMKLAGQEALFERKDGEPAVAEVKKILEDQGKAFEAFKQTVNDRDAEIKRLGQADGLIEEKLNRINASLDKAADELKNSVKRAGERIDQIETALKRSPKGVEEEKRERAELEAKAFRDFARKGGNSSLGEFLAASAEYKALSVGSDPDGGYTVLPDMNGRVIQKVFETSPIRQIASVTTISTDALEGPEDRDEATVGWVAETGTRAQTNTPQRGKWRIPVHEIYAMPAATQQLLDDSAVNQEEWLAEKVSDKFARTENTAFVSGNGDGKPRGFLDYSSTNVADSTRTWGVLEYVKTGTNGSYGTSTNGAEKLIDLVHSMKTAYRTGASFVMSRATLGETRKLKDGQGAFLWLPAMTSGQNSQLLGFPVVEAEDMPAVSGNGNAVAFGNFRLGYQIVDRQGIRVLRDPYSSKPYVLFYTTKRVGGAVLHPEAIKFLRFAA
jgi:HK97 family phage major capsid protein